MFKYLNIVLDHYQYFSTGTMWQQNNMENIFFEALLFLPFRRRKGHHTQRSTGTWRRGALISCAGGVATTLAPRDHRAHRDNAGGAATKLAPRARPARRAELALVFLEQQGIPPNLHPEVGRRVEQSGPYSAAPPGTSVLDPNQVLLFIFAASKVLAWNSFSRILSQEASEPLSFSLPQHPHSASPAQEGYRL